MLNDKIQAPTTNVFGLMATPAVPCMLGGQNTTPRLKAVPKAVNVAIGRTTDLTAPCEYWAATDTDHDYGYGYEAIYDPKQISLVDAEQWVRTQLAEQDVNVAQFINEDEPDRAEQIERVIAVLPDAVDHSMRTALPHRYTPELAAQFAQTMAAELRQPTDEPATESGPVATPAAGIIAQLKANADAANKAGLGSPALDAFNAKVIRLVSASPDPEATIGELAQLLHREPVRTTNCRLFPAWCIENGPHYDHVSADIKVIDTEGEDVIDARVLYLSDSTPIVCIGQSDFTADQARMKAAELRCLADRIDELSGHVDKAHAPRA